MTTLKGKTLFISGASRGIGLAIALRAARDGANVAIIAKTAEANPKLPYPGPARGHGVAGYLEHLVERLRMPARDLPMW